MNKEDYIAKGRDKLIKKWLNPYTPKERVMKDKNDPGLEKNIQKTILEYLTRKGIFHWRNNTGAITTQATSFSKGRFLQFGAKGSPDIICCVDGILVGIEVKTKTGVQSQAQKNFQTNLEKAGGRYHLVRSLDDVMKIL